ncbi:DUF4309 domain-containing protein [Paenibacillus protaetiae]|uniref:DUF4309 domain-containing protein n=2 Tax=Paenibacillus protaetiae TaxID=2509456 RepID=A0A4P6EXZ8_9BACL|nr:DUF4309 domain-containing protein [Paenibacillus protaetiae]
MGGCANNNGSSNGSNVSESPPASATVSPGNNPSSDATATPPAQETSKPDESKALLETIEAAAKEGKVPGCNYAAHIALYDDIEKEWGKADKNDTAGKGIYAVYENKGITFGYNKGMLVFDVRSYAPELKLLTLKQIEGALGQADEKTTSGDDQIYTYNVNKQYQLKFAIPESTGKVDHISVYSPEDAKNLMAG